MIPPTRRPAAIPGTAPQGERGPAVMLGRVQACLTGLLSIEGVLGCAVVARTGQVVGSGNLSQADAAALCRVLASAIGGLGLVHGSGAPSFAAFALQQGQIVVSGGDGLALIALTDPNLNAQALRRALFDALGCLQRIGT